MLRLLSRILSNSLDSMASRWIMPGRARKLTLTLLGRESRAMNLLLGVPVRSCEHRSCECEYTYGYIGFSLVSTNEFFRIRPGHSKVFRSKSSATASSRGAHQAAAHASMVPVVVVERLRQWISETTRVILFMEERRTCVDCNCFVRP